MTDEIKFDAAELIRRIEARGFRNEAGSLVNSLDWIELKEMVEDLIRQRDRPGLG
jgi:hypothetical protein